MASVTALIQFTQGFAGIPGQVFVGTTAMVVSIANNVNTNVNSWQIDLVYTPPGSTVPIALPLAFNNASSIPAASFTPDVAGSYRIVLTVWAVINRIGTNYDVDIRNFVIPLPGGLVIPPYQKDPDKLPTLASGRPGAKPNEMNINGTELGWAGDGFDGLLDELVKRVDSGNSTYTPAIPASWSPVPTIVSAALDQLVARIVLLEAGGPTGEVVDSFITIPAQTVFVLSFTPAIPGNVELHVNGVLYEQDEYSVVGLTLTWNNTAFVFAGGEEVEVRYLT
jgi:hypothetical protein